MACVSIIVPCYNAGRFIRSFGRMLCQQTYTNWICFFIDDCSTDNTRSEIDWLVSTDSRFKLLLTNTNSGGPFIPRSIGLKHVVTPYVCLLDIDDVISRFYLEEMIKWAERDLADVAFPDMQINGTPVTRISFDKVYRGRELAKRTILDWSIGCNGGVYKINLIKNIYLSVIPELCRDVFGENSASFTESEIRKINQPEFSRVYDGILYPRFIDEVATRLILMDAQRVIFVREAIYEYIPSSGSISDSTSYQSLGFLLNDFLLSSLISGPFTSENFKVLIFRQQISNMVDKMVLLKKINTGKYSLSQAKYREGYDFVRLLYHKVERKKMGQYVEKYLLFVISLSFSLSMGLVWLRHLVLDGYDRIKNKKSYKYSFTL